MFDTHCHLNFSRFKNNLEEVITSAQNVGVSQIVIPGTDIATSKKAVEIAQKHEGVYAAVGIHPHHVYEMLIGKAEVKISILSDLEGTESQRGGFHGARNVISSFRSYLQDIEQLLLEEKVVAVGEIGLDRHVYTNTKYEKYSVNEEFITMQKELFISQLKLAKKYRKSVIIHNREARDILLPLLEQNWDGFYSGRMVFHCCEPDGGDADLRPLLEFARGKNIFIGVDGDITYTPEKQEFIKKIPLELLVLETDAPFLLPEPLRSQKKFPNEPKNLKLICEFIAGILNIEAQQLAEITQANGKQLFALN